MSWEKAAKTCENVHGRRGKGRGEGWAGHWGYCKGEGRGRHMFKSKREQMRIEVDHVAV